MPLTKIVAALSVVPGLRAIALGGSRSRGEASQNSDYDIGLYYDGGSLDLASLEKALKSLDDRHRDGLLNPPGAWGPWINGGAWLTVGGEPVDILLRDLSRVEQTVNDCVAGVITIDYQAGHPFGFVNAIYAAETHYCQPLWQDERAPLDRLKAILHAEGEYPPRMRETMVRRFMWEAWFSLACARTAAHRGDFHYAEGAVFRAVSAWTAVLYALNFRYMMNEKGALSRVRELARKPADMEGRVRAAYGLLAEGKADEAYALLDALQSEMDGLTREFQTVQTEIR